MSLFYSFVRCFYSPPYFPFHRPPASFSQIVPHFRYVVWVFKKSCNCKLSGKFNSFFCVMSLPLSKEYENSWRMGILLACDVLWTDQWNQRFFPFFFFSFGTFFNHPSTTPCSLQQLVCIDFFFSRTRRLRKRKKKNECYSIVRQSEANKWSETLKWKTYSAPLGCKHCCLNPHPIRKHLVVIDIWKIFTFPYPSPHLP